MKNNTTTATTQNDETTFFTKFKDEVLQGLLANPKHMDSKYFYDAAGDRLFQQIMDAPEYYPTRSEFEIFIEQADELSQVLMGDGDAFDLIELGAGDASKSGHLLKNLIGRSADFKYIPIDISENIISYLNQTLPVSFPGIRIEGKTGEYFQMLREVTEKSEKRRKVILFLGSNIGNMSLGASMDFCVELRKYLNKGDLVLMGIDLKKNPRIILDAYNDKAGITKEFNLNLLTRVNRELNANFDITKFEHYPMYNPETGECKSYLISLEQQQVVVSNMVISFEKDEYIDMEISQKYTVEQAERLAANAGFSTVTNFFDKKKWFLDTIWSAD